MFSFHGKGAHVVFADGNVSFVQESTSPAVLWALATRSDGKNEVATTDLPSESEESNTAEKPQESEKLNTAEKPQEAKTTPTEPMPAKPYPWLWAGGALLLIALLIVAYLLGKNRKGV